MDDVYSVSELVAELRDWLAEAFADVWVEGEVGGLTRSRAGHLYLSLKGADAQLDAVLFRGSARQLPLEPEDGLVVRAHGRVDLYAPRGRLQLIVDELRPRGEGALRLAFERLRVALEAEGLFDASRKRPLPLVPRRIGVVTSVRGAALHDFLRALGQRWPAADVLVCDASVQGESAWREVVRALHLLDARDDVDVLVLTRGGGSLEDLWTFNREELVRAIVELQKPVVSAIGHEVDMVLTDLAADARAPTPTAAAALVAPDAAALRARIGELDGRLQRAARGRLERSRERVTGLQRGLVHPAQRLAAGRARCEQLAGRLRAALDRAAERRRGGLASLAGRLDALSPLAVLGRGYALARREADGALLRDGRQVKPDDMVSVRLARGGLRARVTGTTEEP